MTVSNGVATTSRVPSAVAPTTRPHRLSERRRGRPPFQDVDRRHVAEACGAAAIAQQQIAAPVERHFTRVEDQRGRVDVGGLAARWRCAPVGRHRPRRAPRLGYRRPWRSISTGTRRSMPSASGTALRKPDPPAALREERQAADDARRAKRRRVDAGAAATGGSAASTDAGRSLPARAAVD